MLSRNNLIKNEVISSKSAKTSLNSEEIVDFVSDTLTPRRLIKLHHHIIVEHLLQ
jgi:hypothetical protein